MFYVGQKVVCINEQGWVNQHGGPSPESSPVEDGIYTVLGKMVERPSGDLYLAFGEIGEEHTFLATCFRPVVTTDISVFKRMLAPKEVEHV